jgi:phosphatidate cytidylyltransferase
MTPDNQAFCLTAGIFGVLVFASVVGLVLKFTIARGGPNSTVDNLIARVNAWWVMAAVIGLALLVGKTGVTLLFMFVSFVALREYVTLTPTRRGDHWALVVSFFIVLPFQYFLAWIEWYGLFTILIPVHAFLILPLLEALSGDTRNFMQRTALVQWGLMVTVYCISYVPALLSLDIPGYEGRNEFLIVYLILVVQSSDVLQYVWGKLIGKHKIAPNLSPSKTVEGFVGGVASATLLGGALWWITPFEWWQSALMALIVNLMGFVGGLVMSAIKRDRGVKDWGAMIEGHGGMLDRVDSLCFSAPMFFHVIRYLWVP